MSMNGKICPKCQIELRPLKNGVTVIEMAIHGPQALWHADLWHCVGCRLQVILDLGQKPMTSCYDEDWAEVSARILATEDQAFPIFLNAYERDEHLRTAKATTADKQPEPPLVVKGKLPKRYLEPGHPDE